MKYLSRNTLLDFLEQLYYQIKVPLFEWKEQQWVRRHFYSDPVFKALDQELLSGPSPYPIARVFPYGETPLRALFRLGQIVNLKPTDRFVDLGCGRGRSVFFLSHFFGCEAVGVDLTPSFVRRAQYLAKVHRQRRVTFQCQDFVAYDLKEATCVYLYGTTYPEETFRLLEDRLQDLPLGARVITVSDSLSKHLISRRSGLRLNVKFPWGRGSLFVHCKISNTMPMFVLEPPRLGGR